MPAILCSKVALSPMLAIQCSKVALFPMLAILCSKVAMDNMGKRLVQFLATTIKHNRPIIQLTITGKLCSNLDLRPAMVSRSFLLLLPNPRSSTGLRRTMGSLCLNNQRSRDGQARRIISTWPPMVIMMLR